jgi:hypothetical protein
MHNQPGGTPVFVDGTGRRRRRTVIAGTAMGLGLLTSLGLIAAGLFGGSSVSLPGWTDAKVEPPIEAGVDGLGGDASPTPRSSLVTSTAVPLPSSAPTTIQPGPGPATATRTAPAPGPGTSGQPGLGDERRSAAKPSRSPGKPR